jgi:rhodanese-related sulfurtransferase
MKQTSCSELQDLQTPEALLLDVREPWELGLAALQLPGWRTLNIPMSEITQRLHELNPVHRVVCICHHGIRSAQVLTFLETQGFEDIYNLSGGIDAWSLQMDARIQRY